MIRKLLTQNGQRPIARGLFLPLDHSTVVVAAHVAIPLTAATVDS